MSKKKKENKLSLCMVLKNEGQTIYKCLESVYSANAVDEWVIGIDDKCTDNTKDETLRFFEDKKLKTIIYDYTWEDSFSKARNIGMDKATGDFILILDGHEFIPDNWYNITEKKRIDSGKVLKGIKGQLDAETMDQVFFALYQQPFIGETPNNYFMQPRIYRNGKGENGKKIRYGRAAHNVIQNTDPKREVHYPEMMLIHDAPADNRKERQIQRIEMNTRELKLDLKKNPNDLRARFYLANTRMEAKDFDVAIKHFTKYIDTNKKFHNEKYQALMHRGLCYREIGKNDEKRKEECDQLAVADFYQAMSITPDRRDAYQLIGDTFLQSKNYDMAIHLYSQCLMIQPKPSRMFNNGPAATWYPYQQLAQAYLSKGDNAQCISYLKACLNYVDNDGWRTQIKQLQGDNKNILIIDHIGSFTSDFEKHLRDNGYNVIRSKTYNETLALWADRIWIEWADQNATLNRHPEKTIIRVHGYEAYINKPLFNSINWNVRSVVFVADHIKNKMQSDIPSLNGQCKVIHNGVDIDKFYIKNKKRADNAVGYAGFMNVKKNPMRLAKIIKDNPGYDFNLRIDWQDPFLKDAFEYETKDCTNITSYGRFEDLNDFWNQMSYVISTSDIESFSFNIAEAMSAGCTPLIYNWNGAKDIWRNDFIFDDMPKFELRDQSEMRDYIVNNYSLTKSNQEMEAVLK